MPHRFTPVIEAAQIMFIGLLGLGSSIYTWNDTDIKRMLVTVVSMALGTIVSYYIKRFLNRKE